MSAVSEQRTAEWPSLRLGLAGAVALGLVVLFAWAVESASSNEPSRYAQTERCLTHEKLLTVTPAARDAIAATASGGALATRIDGNGVHVLIGRSTKEAERLAAAYRRVSGPLTGRLEVRGVNVYVWEGVATPNQRQVLYDCKY
jgi:hypothetical protein